MTSTLDPRDVRWLVVIVVVYTAYGLLRGGWQRVAKGASVHGTDESARVLADVQ